MKNAIFLMLFLLGFARLSSAQELNWGAAYGGPSSDSVTCLKLDTFGNVYSSGRFLGTVDFDPGPGTFNLSSVVVNSFIQKLDKDGNLVWAKQIETGWVSYQIAVDDAESVYIYGTFTGTVDFDPGVGIFNMTATGSSAISLCKLDANGNFVWAKQIGGSGRSSAGKMEKDHSGNLYLTGEFDGTVDFDPNLGTTNLTALTSSDGFILKLDANGNFGWVRQSQGITISDIDIDAGSAVYYTGRFYNTIDIDLGVGVNNLSSSGSSDGFISKLDASGNFVWVIQIGSTASNTLEDNVSQIEIDNFGNLICLGYFWGTVDFDPGPAVYNLTGPSSFILKLDANSNLIWVKDGISALNATDLALGPENEEIYFSGIYHGTVDLTTGTAVSNYTSAGSYDFFLTKLDALGNSLWVGSWGGTSMDVCLGLELDKYNNIYMTGTFRDIIDLDPSIQTHSVQATNTDIYTLRLSQQGISGSVYLDLNQNCVRDQWEQGLANRTLLIQPGNIVVQTNSVGIWYLDFLPLGSYTIVADTLGPWTTTCPYAQGFSVTTSGGYTYAPNFGFVSTNPCAVPNVSIHAPRLLWLFGNYVYIEVCNDYLSTGLLENNYIVVEFNPDFVVQYANVPYTALGNNQFRVDLDTLYPGQCFDFLFYCYIGGSSIPGQTLCMSANLYPVDACVLDSIPNPYPAGINPCNTAYDDSHLEISSSCYQDSILQFVITNSGTGDMSCFSAVRVLVDGQLTSLDSIQLTAGSSAQFFFHADGRTWRLETDQHPLHPGNSNPSATIELCGDSNNWTSGLVNILPMDDADPVVDIYCGVVTGSYDPNDKTGYPLGVDSAHYILQNQDIEYVVRFQNTGTDTAFTVVIRDTLSTDLDIFSVRSGVSSHNYSFRMHGPRVLEWTFNNIMLPDSNVNEAESHGFIKFKVSQNQDLPFGTVINNSAAIYFDFNAPVITNTYFHTIGDPFMTVIATATEPIAANVQQASVRVMPNPMNSSATLLVEGLSNYEDLTLEVYNLMGQGLQIPMQPTFNGFSIQRGDLAAGVYVFSVKQAGKVVVTGKLVVQ